VAYAEKFLWREFH